MLTRHLAKRLASDHITVNAIAPGPFESKMTAFMFEAPDARERSRTWSRSAAPAAPTTRRGWCGSSRRARART